MIFLYIGIGGFFGAISRYLIAGYIQKASSLLFPVGTLSVNVLGSFIIGFMAMYFSQIVEPEYKAMVITGFLGALTTFSTFSLENINLIQDGEIQYALLNIALNVILTLGSTFAGIVLFRKIYTL